MIDHLNAAEKEIVAAAAQAREANLGSHPPGSVSAVRPSVRAEVLRTLLCGERDDWQVRGGRVQICHGAVQGPLNLTEAQVPVSVSLIDMNFDEPLVLSDANTRDIRLTKSMLPRLDAKGLRCNGDLVLDNIWVAEGVRLDAAVVAGSVRCQSAHLGWDSPSGPGLSLVGTRISGNLDCDSSYVQHAVVGSRLIVSGDALFEGFTADSLDLNRAEVHTLRCTNATLYGTEGQHSTETGCAWLAACSLTRTSVPRARYHSSRAFMPGARCHSSELISATS